MNSEESSSWRRNSSGTGGAEAAEAEAGAPAKYRFIAGRTMRRHAPAATVPAAEVPAAEAPAAEVPTAPAPSAPAEDEPAEAPEPAPATYRFTVGRPMRRLGT